MISPAYALSSGKVLRFGDVITTFLVKLLECNVGRKNI